MEALRACWLLVWEEKNYFGQGRFMVNNDVDIGGK